MYGGEVRLSQKKALKCYSCDKSFSRMNYLKLHVTTVHENIKAHICDSCERAFGRKGTLNLKS